LIVLATQKLLPGGWQRGERIPKSLEFSSTYEKKLHLFLICPTLSIRNFDGRLWPE